jgi:hypothetical protein
MHLERAVAQLAGKGDNLGNHQLGHAARIGKRRVEDGNAMLGGILQVYLVGADAETADDEQVLGLLQNLGCEFCL